MQKPWHYPESTPVVQHGGLCKHIWNGIMSPSIYLTATEASNKRTEYFDLLDQNLNEQTYQKYLEDNPEFIPREFIQNHGLHLSTVFRKFPLSSEYIPDFLYVSKSSDDWNVVFIEIEKPSSKYFLNNTTNFHNDGTNIYDNSEFLSALGWDINEFYDWLIQELYIIDGKATTKLLQLKRLIEI